MHINIIKAATFPADIEKNYIVYYMMHVTSELQRTSGSQEVSNQKEVQLIYSGTYNQTSVRRK